MIGDQKGASIVPSVIGDRDQFDLAASDRLLRSANSLAVRAGRRTGSRRGAGEAQWLAMLRPPARARCKSKKEGISKTIATVNMRKISLKESIAAWAWIAP